VQEQSRFRTQLCGGIIDKKYNKDAYYSTRLLVMVNRIMR